MVNTRLEYTVFAQLDLVKRSLLTTTLLRRLVIITFEALTNSIGNQHSRVINVDASQFLQSKEEYEASVCLCGSQVCRGSYLNLTGEGAFQKVHVLMPELTSMRLIHDSIL